MKVLMFGWEFPPFNSGGLGTACYGLTKSLVQRGVDITFVVPYWPTDKNIEFGRIIAAQGYGNEGQHKMIYPIGGYASPDRYISEVKRTVPDSVRRALYGRNLFEEVKRYADKAAKIAREVEHDIIHAHDWMTFEAALKAKQVSGKPLIVHIHATESDRTGGNGAHPEVYEIERKGLQAADRIIAVSNFTKKKIIEQYGIEAGRISVVHNAVEWVTHFLQTKEQIFRKEQIVLFLGRITLQKGPDYFLAAAKKVLEHKSNVSFIIAGTGDLLSSSIEQAAAMGMSNKIFFTGFLQGEAVDRVYRMADLYVMPSVSEPFGITPLEALRNNVPVLISKQSGVSEILQHSLKVDFWDVNELANKIICVLEYKELARELRCNGTEEVRRIKWSSAADKCIKLYQQLQEQQLMITCS